jgi:hypothetical protein
MRRSGIEECIGPLITGEIREEEECGAAGSYGSMAAARWWSGEGEEEQWCGSAPAKKAATRIRYDELFFPFPSQSEQ